MIHKFLIILILFSILTGIQSPIVFKTNQNGLECCTKRNTNLTFYYINCKNMKSFKQLKELDLIKKNSSTKQIKSCKTYLNLRNLDRNFVFELSRHPDESIRLDRTFDLSLLLKFSKRTIKYDTFNMLIRNMKGFDLRFHLFNGYRNDSFLKIQQEFYMSNMYLLFNDEFYSSKCDLAYIKQLIGENATQLNKIYGNKVIFHKHSRYQPNTCSYLFMNSRIDHLEIYDIKNSLIEKNKLTFTDMLLDENRSSVDLANLNCSIKSVKLEIYRVNLDYRLLSKQIFKDLQSLTLLGVIDRIESNFDPFDRSIYINLTQIKFQISNIREFLHLNSKWLQKYSYKSTLNWMNDFENLNNFCSIEFNDVDKNDYKEIAGPWHLRFDLIKYNDADFCLFSQYPINKTIFYVLLTSSNVSECSCTMAYLLQNYRFNSQTIKYGNEKYYSNQNYKYNSIYSSCIEKLNRTEFEFLIKKCNFEQRLQMCHFKNHNIESRHYFYLNVYDMIYNVKIIKFIFNILGTPIASIMGVILNTIIIIVLHLRKSNLVSSINVKTEIMFDYILIDSVINLLACLLFSFQLVTECIDFTSIYCSSFYFSINGQEFFIYGINFMGTSLKIASSLTTILFSLSRYLIIARKETIFCIRLFKLKPFVMLLVVILLSMILSVIKIFLNDRYYYVLHPDYDYYLYDFQKEFDEMFRKYNILNIICFVFNDIIIIALIVLIDSLILKKVKEVRRNTANLHRPEALNKTEHHLNMLIIYNGLFSFMLRLPDVFFNSIFAYYNYDKWNVNTFKYCYDVQSRENSICLNLIQVANFFYILSFSLDFFLLLKFNVQFRNVFMKLFRIRFKKMWQL